MKLNTILVPVDFSEHSKAAFEYAQELALAFNASLELVYVWDQPPYLGGTQLMLSAPGQTAQTIAEYTKQKIQENLDQFKASLPLNPTLNFKMRYEIGEIATKLIEAATSVDLVVMGTHGRSGISHFLLGSVAEKVIRGASCPVLTLKAKK
jgi:universal stress protein A